MLATGTWNGEVQGLNELQAQYEQQYGPGDYVPNVFIQYWSMRVMAYLRRRWSLLLALWGCGCCGGGDWPSRAVFLWRRDRGPSPLPFMMNTAGWMLTENGRQPWIVQGLHAHQRRGLAVGRHRPTIVISIIVFFAASTRALARRGRCC